MLPPQVKFCKDVEPGNNAAKECLEEHRNENGFSSNCKSLLEKMMERRAEDFRLEEPLIDACSDDMNEKCGMSPDDLSAIKGKDELKSAQKSVMNCLQDFRDELRASCKAQVNKMMKRSSQDIRFDTSLAEACQADRQKLCSGIQPGSARVIRCLEDQREKLTQECSASLFDFEVHMAESIDFNFPMKQSCSEEINRRDGGMRRLLPDPLSLPCTSAPPLPLPCTNLLPPVTEGSARTWCLATGA